MRAPAILAAILVYEIAAFAAWQFAEASISVAPASADRPCIALDLTLRTYDGPLVIDGACVDFISITSTALRVVAHDTGDGIFRSGFEGAP